MGKPFEGSEQIRAEIIKIWKDVLDLDAIDDHANFLELGAHSMTVIKLLYEIKKRFAVKISIKEFFENPTIDYILSKIEKSGEISII
jgi:acyl carrier protein